MATDDELAVGALKFALQSGIEIPEKMEVVGCNNSVLSISCYPELSSVDNMCEALCVDVYKRQEHDFSECNNFSHYFTSRAERTRETASFVKAVISSNFPSLIRSLFTIQLPPHAMILSYCR